MISSKEIRQKYLDFFKSKKHSIIPSSSLIPENDPSVLFNTAWMQPLVPYLLWEKHPMWNRLANCQKCVRTVDIDDVWDNRHLTFFEMLWNWSLWDYFKKESIEWSYEFLTSKNWLWIDPKFLAVSVFEWDADSPRDDYSAWIWESIWMPKERISYLWKSDNWWAAWDTGPCGPDTEIFYWVWEWDPHPSSNVMHDPDNWLEIWNNVFMEYNKLPDWKLVKLPAQNVDTWMWLERIVAVLNWVKTVYETDMFLDVLVKIKNIVWDNNYKEKSARIIADHTRTWVMMISDWVVPMNNDQWYILRRLLRKSIREAYKMWYESSILSVIWNLFINKYKDIYPNISHNSSKIIDELNKEEERFWSTIKSWLKEFEKLLHWMQIAFEKTWKRVIEINWKQAFKLYDTYWFPLEMTVDLANEHNLSVDKIMFKELFREHQEKSRQWSQLKFKWWLADTWEMSVKYHTATHLLHKALKNILWDHVEQKWSNITSERLRFDFSNPDRLNAEQIKAIEDMVNDVIEKHLDVFQEEMTIDEAKKSWAIWLFESKYWDNVKVYTIWKSVNDYFSKEICWWPHVKNTRELWTFRIQKEESSSAWIRRIKAILD